MSLKQTAITEIPEDTARVAKAVFKKGHRYLLLRDAFGELFSSEEPPRTVSCGRATRD